MCEVVRLAILHQSIISRLTFYQLPRHKLAPLHFTATRDDGPNSYRVHNYTTDSIIGTILVAEGAHFSPEDVHKALKDGLASDSVKPSPSSEQSQAGTPDEWLVKGLYILQARGITGNFDVDEFIIFAKDYITQRERNEGPAMIAYPRLHKELSLIHI